MIVGAATASAVVGYYFYDKKNKADTSNLNQASNPAKLTIQPPHVIVEEESTNTSIGKTSTNSVNSQAKGTDANKIKVPDYIIPAHDVKQEDKSGVSRKNGKEEDVRKDGK